MAVDLKNHPGLNPEYFGLMDARRSAIIENRVRREQAAIMKIDPRGVRLVSVPKQPNKYVPHTGAKERAKYAGRTSL